MECPRFPGHLTTTVCAPATTTPATAQFLTRDPLEARTRSPYSYADGAPLDASDPLGLEAYHYSFDLGSLGSPEELAAFARGRCASLFPIEGCADNFNVGQTMRLHKSVLFYTQSFPVKVIGLTSTSFEFQALSGHPEGEGRTITFSFCTADDGNTHLNVDTSSDGSIATWWWGVRSVDFFLAHRTWSNFASTLRANYDYAARDGNQASGLV